VRSDGSGEAGRTELSPRNHAGEYLMMSLRTASGTDLTRWNAIAGTTLKATKLENLIELGLLELEKGFLRATRQGRMVLDAILTDLLPE
jgi:oxygen-independent coproporphyrinogen-3 oxidase